jgi:hypothetical protein
VFEAVVPDPRELDVAAGSMLYVSAARWRRVEARGRGIRAAAPDALGPVLATRGPLPTILAI